MEFTSIIQRLGKFIVNPEIKNKIYQVMLSKPSLTQREIAEEVGVHESTVSRVIRSLTKGNDYQIATRAASKFLQEFVNAAEFWKLQITELEKLKEITEDSNLKLKIMREQSDRYEKILVLARQWEVIQIVRKINRMKSQVHESKSGT